MTERIHLIGDSPALRIPVEILQSAGMAVGDELEIRVVDGIVLLVAVGGEQRQQSLETAVEDVLQRRRSAYEQLAEFDRAGACVLNKNTELYHRLSGDSD